MDRKLREEKVTIDRAHNDEALKKFNFERGKEVNRRHKKRKRKRSTVQGIAKLRKYTQELSWTVTNKISTAQ